MKTVAGVKGSIICCVACLLVGIPAHAFELNGAWANDLAVCNNVFVKKNNAISIASNSDNYGSGFIIEGNRIRGKMVTCIIKSRKEDGGLLQLITACSTDVALSTVQFSLKMDGDNKLIRVFPGIPELAMSYVRCRL